ncbi:MAG: hypothetical protein IJI57_13520 [Flexilinea sp.]|nr:hypothetical protein [Flexilinea sp.]
MVDGEILEKIYQENLEENLIACLADIKKIGLDEAMNCYYQSKLSDKISRGLYGIQYLDYRVLAQILLDTEPELFAKQEEKTAAETPT